MPNNFPFTFYNVSPTSQDVLIVQMRVTSVAVEMAKGQGNVQMRRETAV